MGDVRDIFVGLSKFASLETVIKGMLDRLDSMDDALAAVKEGPGNAIVEVELQDRISGFESRISALEETAREVEKRHESAMKEAKDVAHKALAAAEAAAQVAQAASAASAELAASAAPAAAEARIAEAQGPGSESKATGEEPEAPVLEALRAEIDASMSDLRAEIATTQASIDARICTRPASVRPQQVLASPLSTEVEALRAAMASNHAAFTAELRVLASTLSSTPELAQKLAELRVAMDAEVNELQAALLASMEKERVEREAQATGLQAEITERVNLRTVPLLTGLDALRDDAEKVKSMAEEEKLAREREAAELRKRLAELGAQLHPAGGRPGAGTTMCLLCGQSPRSLSPGRETVKGLDGKCYLGSSGRLHVGPVLRKTHVRPHSAQSARLHVGRDPGLDFRRTTSTQRLLGGQKGGPLRGSRRVVDSSDAGQNDPFTGRGQQ